MSMTTGPTRLLRPSTVLATLNGPPLPAAVGAPLTEDERAVLGRLDRTGG
jgi:hypothetical protein